MATNVVSSILGVDETINYWGWRSLLQPFSQTSISGAYTNHSIDTSSTPQELVQTYSNATEILHELKDVWNDGTEVIYAVDCCKLEAAMDWDMKSNQLDLIMFNHPHLGDATLYETEAHHAERHYALLCHYFHSAAKL